jgi:hypothetical protein
MQVNGPVEELRMTSTTRPPPILHKAHHSRTALAMLPLGGAMMLVSAGAFVLIALLFVDTLLRHASAAGLLLAWCLAALVAAARNTLKSIEAMSVCACRPMVEVAILSALIIAAYPGWWLHH